jgi:hypothetical protein
LAIDGRCFIASFLKKMSYFNRQVFIDLKFHIYAGKGITCSRVNSAA